MIQLPADSEFLPLFDGALLVSAQHALFCKIPAIAVDSVRAVLSHTHPFEKLPPTIQETLMVHGFVHPKPLVSPQKTKVQLQLTNACNLKCSYCCTNSSVARKDELDVGAFEQVLRDVRLLLGEGTKVSLLGGEPFLVPGAIGLAESALELGLQPTIYSNGMVLFDDDEMLGHVAELTQKGVQMRISLASAAAHSCDALSGTKRFDAVVEGLQKLAQRGGHADVDIMLMPQNAEEMSQEFRILKKRLPSHFKISIGVLYLSGREKGEHLFFSNDELEQALTDISFEAGENIDAPLPSPVMPRRDGCDCAVGYNLNVRSDGSLFSCFKMEERIGHISTLSIKEALAHLRENPHPASSLQTCKNCPLQSLCGGGCRSDNFLYTGSGEPYCAPWRVRVVSEMLAEDRIEVVNWSVGHLYAEAQKRNISVPNSLPPTLPSRHCLET
ncbi:MAG: radical SAM protein [Deltaproteobacteria bacterium]|nr:radical SAM protein [Deltaproteobacteria bacterium]MBN2670580.1 radical SAM protein [Deltaproteobacteria bacterium]